MNPPYSVSVRLHQIGARLERRLEPTDAERAKIAKELDLADLSILTGAVIIEATSSGWKLSGRIDAEGAQTCGITLEPLPFRFDEAFSLNFAEAPDEKPQANDDDEIDIDMDDDSPDLIDDGQIDLGVYLVEQLALRLDPFPRKPGAVFEQPPEPAEISPFAVLKRLNPDKS